jgi:hypothetical protein
MPQLHVLTARPVRLRLLVVASMRCAAQASAFTTCPSQLLRTSLPALPDACANTLMLTTAFSPAERRPAATRGLRAMGQT